MARSPFGWSLPPGAATHPSAPWNQDEGPCEVCGQVLDECICPECPVCGGVGDPACYEDNPLYPRPCGPIVVELHHGLFRSFAQVGLLAEADRYLAEEAEQSRRAEEERERLDAEVDRQW